MLCLYYWILYFRITNVMDNEKNFDIDKCKYNYLTTSIFDKKDYFKQDGNIADKDEINSLLNKYRLVLYLLLISLLF